VHAALGDQIYDLVQNAIEAGSSRIVLRIAEEGTQLTLEVTDNGCGMSEAELQRALDPFSSNGRKHRQRKVGLGLPFLRQTVEATGGALAMRSQPGAGTRVSVQLNCRHCDLPPAGDWSETITGLLAFEGGYELIVEREKDGRAYRLSRRELAETLGEIDSAVSLNLAKQYVASCEEAIRDREGNSHGSHDA
jgi:hypothetical protein